MSILLWIMVFFEIECSLISQQLTHRCETLYRMVMIRVIVRFNFVSHLA